MCKYLVVLGLLFLGTGCAFGLSGGGTESDPWVIGSLADFDAFASDPNYWDDYVRLDVDIDLGGRPSYTTAVIAPDTDDISNSFGGTPFEGVFDGDGHVIRNLTIDTAGAGYYYLGLFGRIEGPSAEVKNLGLENANIAGGDHSKYLGGLCGYNRGNISNCYAIVSVTGGDFSTSLGGLCGYNYFGAIFKCYAISSVSGGYYSVHLGGLCGNNRDGTISNCYANGSVPDGYYSRLFGGLCGENSFGTITNSFFLDPADGGGLDNGLGIPLRAELMKQQDSFLYWDFVGETVNGTNEIWQMASGGGFPVLSSFNGYKPVVLSGDGTKASPYLVSNAMELGAVYHYNRYSSFRLGSDIDLNGITWSSAVVPVFGGSFDGNGHTIYNLNIESGSYLGLFGQIKGSGVEIKNLGLENVNIVGVEDSRCLGGLCGYNYGSTISNCYSVGSVNSGYNSDTLGGLCGYNYGGTIISCYSVGSVDSGESSEDLGGLCGNNRDGTITNCYFAGSVKVEDKSRWVGGLCGYNWEGTITNCYATGSVNGGDNSSWLGGLCGYNYFGNISNCFATSSFLGSSGSDYLGGLCGRNHGTTITNCYAAGLVSGRDYLGGLCGQNWFGTVTNCYATGSVTGNDRLGGLCGSNFGDRFSKGIISNCYATGLVTGRDSSDELGGLCGENTRYCINKNCFWDMQTSGMTSGYPQDSMFPGTITNVIGKTTLQMQTEITFTEGGWNFVGGDGDVADWMMLRESEDYPRLRWQEIFAGDIGGLYGVDLVDFGELAFYWGEGQRPEDGGQMTDGPPYRCDIDGDGFVGIGDLVYIVEGWGE